jgi:DNA-binding NarL/FixJ family response regulator
LNDSPAPRTPSVGLAPRPDAPQLTERQVEVLRLVSAGRTNIAIAFELGLSEKTVKAHVTAIFKAMNVFNRTQAAAVARAIGLI